MSWKTLAVCVAASLTALACSDSPSPPAPATLTPIPPSFVAPVAPAATPLPAEILNDGCPVSEPNGMVPPGEDPDFASNVLGNGALFVGLYPDGTVVFEPGGYGTRAGDGTLAMKFWWWRGVEGQLEISGRRLDGDSGPMWAEVPGGYGDTGFQATGLVFPGEGCWEVTGRVGESTLTFVTRIVSFYAPFKRPANAVELESCPVTAPNGATAPGQSPSSFDYGDDEEGIWTHVWPNGEVVFTPDGPGELRQDGWLAMKWLWFRDPPAPLQLSGRRLDAPAPPLRADILRDQGDGNAQPSIILFPTPGCWEVVAQAGTSVLVLVTRVVSFYPAQPGAGASGGSSQ
jgi:hypothetical protein